ncbi:hypothetical protein F183_A44630 [Bryobacterales bacterium F-183]|nr:hypothetical protein F183_A44630 [Bryobacterales bacterium F-183]
MVEISLSTGQPNPPLVPYQPVALRDRSDGTTRASASVVSPNFIRAFGSGGQNSRAPGSLGGQGRFGIRWQFAVDGAPNAVLVAGDRIVAQRSNGWELMSSDGKKVASGPPSRSLITLDPSVGMFYVVGSGNALQAMAMDTGEMRFALPLGQNESFSWPLVHRSGKVLMIAGVEQPMMSPRPRRPERSLFQAVRIASPIQLSPYKLLLSLEQQRDMVFKEANMLPVGSGEVLWAAMPNLLVRTSPAQTVDGAWTDTFRPLAVSVDEMGWLYLVAECGAQNQRELWIVTTEGVRVSRSAVPPAFWETKVPPAVGYDHRVYLRAAQDIAAFAPSGELLWEVRISGQIAGMTVTPDGRVVAAAGRAVYQIDPGGKVTPVFAELPGSATTAPVVTAQGEILVGTETGVVCLTAQ